MQIHTFQEVMPYEKTMQKLYQLAAVRADADVCLDGAAGHRDRGGRPKVRRKRNMELS